MKKCHILLLTFTFFVNSNLNAQIKSKYALGFESGFKEGYCYENATYDCFYPLTPEAPLPRLNESRDNYQQGYNRGFKFGNDLKRCNKSIKQNNDILNNIPSFNSYVQQMPVDAMIAAGMYKQKKHDIRKEWIQNKISNITDLVNTVFASSNLPEEADALSLRKNLIGQLSNFVKKIPPTIDLADDYQFSHLVQQFNKIEKNVYDSYNEIGSRNFEREKSKSSDTKNSTLTTTSDLLFLENIFSEMSNADSLLRIAFKPSYNGNDLVNFKPANAKERHAKAVMMTLYKGLDMMDADNITLVKEFTEYYKDQLK